MGVAEGASGSPGAACGPVEAAGGTVAGLSGDMGSGAEPGFVRCADVTDDSNSEYKSEPRERSGARKSVSKKIVAMRRRRARAGGTGHVAGRRNRPRDAASTG